MTNLTVSYIVIYVVYMLLFRTSYNLYKIFIQVITWITPAYAQQSCTSYDVFSITIVQVITCIAIIGQVITCMMVLFKL
jgi:uncharacterized membrane protein YcjF (UPF0283 family)